MTDDQRGFLSKVLNFMGIQEEVAAAEEDPQPPSNRLPAQTTDEPRRRGRLVSLPSSGKASGRMRVCVIIPRSFEDVQPIADHLKDRQPVIVSLEGAEKELAKRIVDFISGTTYGLDGQIQKVGEDIFLFAPSNVEIDGAAAVEGGLFS